MKYAKSLVAFAAAVATAALAAVTFDAATGTGFVGKGDVQDAFGLSNDQIQKDAGLVQFSMKQIETYSAVCNYTTGPVHNRVPHSPTRTIDSNLASSIDASGRQIKGQQQITGFYLSGKNGGGAESGESLPVEGQPCHPSEGSYWSDVAKTSSLTQLLVSFSGQGPVVIYTQP